MAFKYMESISSQVSVLFTELRKQFLKIAKDSFDLEIISADHNKNFISLTSKSMIDSGEHEKKAKEAEAWGQITGGALSLGAAAISTYVGAKQQTKINRNQKGLENIGETKSNLLKNKTSTGQTENTQQQLDKIEPEIDFVEGTDFRDNSLNENQTSNLGAAIGKPKKRVEQAFNNKESTYSRNITDADRKLQQLGMMTQAVTQAISSISSGVASMVAAAEQFMSACYNALVELARNVTGTNESLGRAAHETASKFLELASKLNENVERLDQLHDKVV